MTRAENPLLLWLIAEENALADRAAFQHRDAWLTYHRGQVDLLRDVLDVCRWLDAEDEWDDPHAAARHAHHINWKRARMAEAGVL